jgi:hypothetical protein
MDVRELQQIIRCAAQTSLILLGTTVVQAGHLHREQPSRPHMSAAYAPNWGFNQTCWSRFPPLPPCPNNECNTMPADYENHPSQSVQYTPQNVDTTTERQLSLPVYEPMQHPHSVFPTQSTPGQNESSGGMPMMPFDGTPHSASPQSIPPASPIPAPGHSSMQPNMMRSPYRQLMARPVSESNQSPQSGARYGTSAPSTMPAPKFNVGNSQTATGRYGVPATSNRPSPSQNPFVPASQSRDVRHGTASTSYRSATSMPPVYESVRPVFPPQQLPQTSNYWTIPGEPLRSTP